MNHPESALRQSFRKKPDNTPDDNDPYTPTRSVSSATMSPFNGWDSLGTASPDMVALMD